MTFLLIFQTLKIIFLLVAFKNLRFFVKIMILTVVLIMLLSVFCVCISFLFFQCKGISKLLLRLSKLTYYNFFLFSFQPLSRVVYVVYVSVENYLLCTRLK